MRPQEWWKESHEILILWKESQEIVILNNNKNLFEK